MSYDTHINRLYDADGSEMRLAEHLDPGGKFPTHSGAARGRA